MRLFWTAWVCAALCVPAAPARAERVVRTVLDEPGGLPSVSAKGRSPRLKAFSITQDERVLSRWELRYDEMGQLRSLDVRWADAPFAVHETLALGSRKSLRVDYEPGGAPRLQAESPDERPWLFSGYDLREGAERSYVTLSHFATGEGRVIPALECFDHDDLAPFVELLGLPGGDTDLFHYDLHPDDEPTFDPKAGTLMIGNWVAALKSMGRVSTVIWAKAPHSYQRPDPRVTGALVHDLREAVSFPGRNVLLSIDLDGLSSTLWPESPDEVRRRASLLGRLSRRIGPERLKAVGIARSAWSHRGSEEFTPRWTSTYLLNAVVSEQQRALGTAVLRRIPGQSLERADMLKPGPRMFGAVKPWWP